MILIKAPLSGGKKENNPIKAPSRLRRIHQAEGSSVMSQRRLIYTTRARRAPGSHTKTKKTTQLGEKTKKKKNQAKSPALNCRQSDFFTMWEKERWLDPPPPDLRLFVSILFPPCKVFTHLGDSLAGRSHSPRRFMAVAEHPAPATELAPIADAAGQRRTIFNPPWKE